MRLRERPTADQIAELADRGESIERFFTRKGKIMPPFEQANVKIENPWLKLPHSSDSYVLVEDSKDIHDYNESKRGAVRIIEESIPEPFIGNPDTARVLLLSLNPGHSESDKDDFLDCDFRKAMFANLRHECQEFPFYPLNPHFSATGAGIWWRKHTRKLQQSAGIDDHAIANRLLVIEWFPYHSEKSALPIERVCESQKYTFQLAKEMLGRGLPVVLMRAKEQWVRVDQRLEKELPLKSRRAWISKGNMDVDLFERIVETLREEK